MRQKESRDSSYGLLKLAQKAHREASMAQDKESEFALMSLSQLYLAKNQLEDIFIEITEAVFSITDNHNLEVLLFADDHSIKTIHHSIKQEHVLLHEKIAELLNGIAEQKRHFIYMDKPELNALLKMDSAVNGISPSTWIFIPFSESSIKGGISIYSIDKSIPFNLAQIITLLKLTTHIGYLLLHHLLKDNLYQYAISDEASFNYDVREQEESINDAIAAKNQDSSFSSESQLLKNQISELQTEVDLLKREAKIKSALFELTQLYSYRGSSNELMQIIFQIVSDLIKIDNFYVALYQNEKVVIPFLVDVKDNFESHMLDENTNPNIGKGLTAYALKKNISLTLTQDEINILIAQGKVQMIGQKPKQWCFMPFRADKLKGGISIQTYSDEPFSMSDITVMNFLVMHIGNLLSLRYTKDELEQNYEELKRTQVQLVQSEKLASIGQLAAGVAHEINNPIGYVNSNLSSLKGYATDFMVYIEALELFEKNVKDKGLAEFSEELNKLEALKKQLDIEYLKDDIEDILKESAFGMEKVRDIVQSLKNFSRLDQEDEPQEADINECIEQTLKIVWNDLKYKCEVEKHFAELPDIYCFPGQLNQVIMNLLVNAGHAIEEKGVITITTLKEGDNCLIKIRDSGKGIPEQNIQKLFEPFFTTKPVGQGTGLGLSISYGIMQKHGGSISVDSTEGVGTEFTLTIPMHGLGPIGV